MPIRAIADGRVIAYRVNQKNEESKYQDDQVDLTLKYSTGFCLIKHEYGVKKRKTAAEKAQEAAAALKKGMEDKVTDGVTLDVGGKGIYSADEFEAFLKDNSKKVTRKNTVKGIKLKDIQVPDSSSKAPNSTGSTEYFFVKATIAENLSETDTFFTKGKEVYLALFNTDGSIFNKSFTAPVSQETRNAPEAPSDDGSEEEQLLNKMTFYSLYMHLLSFDDFEDNPRPSYWEGEKKEDDQVEGNNPKAEESKEDNASLKPKSFNSVVTLDQEIKAGDLVGYMGIYDSLTRDEEDPEKIGIYQIPKRVETKEKENPSSNNDDFERDYAASPIKYDVKKGDNLTRIAIAQVDSANAELGTTISSERMMKEIKNHQDNDAIKKNPHALFPGRTISIPVFKKKESKAEDQAAEAEKESKRQAHIELFILTEDDVNKLLDNPDQLSQGRFYVKVKQGVDLYSGVLSADNPYFTKSKETIVGELKAEQEGKTQAEKDQIKEKYEAWENAAQSVSVKNENILIAELMSREPVKVGTTDFYQIKDGDSNHCRVKKSDVEGEPFCQHDWRKMGFEIAEGSSDSHGYLTDKKTLKIFDELYEKIPREYQAFIGNYHTQKDFIDRVITNKKYEYYRRRIIGRHPTEWQGEDNSKFIKMLELLTRKKDEPEQLSIHLIGVIQKILEDYPDIQRAKALFNHEEERIKKLSFWNDVPELATKQPYHINPIAFLGNVLEEEFIKLQEVTARYPEKIRKIILHCTATPEGREHTVQEVDSWHKNGGYAEIGYHYVVYLDGSLHFGRSENKPGAHVQYYNCDSIGVVYIGGITSTGIAKDTRTNSQIETFEKISKCYCTWS